MVLIVEIVEMVLIVRISLMKFALLLFFEKFNPDETNRKVSLGKRGKFSWFYWFNWLSWLNPFDELSFDPYPLILDL